MISTNESPVSGRSWTNSIAPLHSTLSWIITGTPLYCRPRSTPRQPPPSQPTSPRLLPLSISLQSRHLTSRPVLNQPMSLYPRLHHSIKNPANPLTKLQLPANRLTKLPANQLTKLLASQLTRLPANRLTRLQQNQPFHR